MLRLPEKSRILVVAAHPDDEILGLGATIHKLVKQDHCVARALILGEGITSRSDSRDKKKWKTELKALAENAAAAARIVGYESAGIHHFPDNRFDSVDLLDLVKVIEKEKQEFKPSVVFTHHGGDTNIDHRRLFDAVITCARPVQGEVVRTIVAFETHSSTEWQAFNYPNYFRPNLFSTVSESDIEAKIRAMECYESERREYPHPRSAEALRIVARRYGVMVGAEYAEAFMMIRTIIDP